MAVKLGRKAQLYYNTGDFGDAFADCTWVRVVNVQDLKQDGSTDKVDTTTRDTEGYKSSVAALKDVTITGSLLIDPAQASYTAMRDAWINSTLMDFCLTDGPIATSGTKYFRMPGQVSKLGTDYSMAGAAKADLEISHSADATLTPGYGVVA